LVLNWNLFQGFQNRAKISQSLAKGEMAEIQLEETRGKITLEVINAGHALNASEAGVAEAGNRVRSAREGFRLVQRKYQEGQASLIEFMDARSALTQAEANLIISRFAYLSDIAEFERASAIEIY
jgi:outer membrane protein TolC